MLFDDYYKSSYDQLVTYYPTFYIDVVEMQAVLKAEGDMLDGVKDGIERVFGNCFVDSADEKTIEKLEGFLHIHLRTQKSLEERRRLVKSYLAGSGKLSSALLGDMIAVYTGASSTFEFKPFDEQGNNRLFIDTERGAEISFYPSDIMELISAKLPAHIPYQFNVVYEYGTAAGNEMVFGYPVESYCGNKLAGQEAFMP